MFIVRTFFFSFNKEEFKEYMNENIRKYGIGKL